MAPAITQECLAAITQRATAREGAAGGGVPGPGRRLRRNRGLQGAVPDQHEQARGG